MSSSSSEMYIYFSLAGGALVALPLLLLHSFSLPKASRDQITHILDRLSSGPIAHRGGQPENTLLAFEIAKRDGASAVEVDLEVTKDGHGVLLHDSSIDRTSNGSGRVQDLSLEQLKRFDFGVKFGAEFSGERIPTLHEAVDKCRQLDLHMFLEVKRAKVRNFCYSPMIQIWDLPLTISTSPELTTM